MQLRADLLQLGFDRCRLFMSPGPIVTTDDSGTWTASDANISLSSQPRPGGPLLNQSIAVLSGGTLALSFDAPSYAEGIAARRVTSVWRK